MNPTKNLNRSRVAKTSDVRPGEERLRALAVRRIAIEGVTPMVDGGRFAVKRIAREVFPVEADIFCEGHGHVGALLLHRRADEKRWTEKPLTLLGNDRWRTVVSFPDNAGYVFTIVAWRDLFATWCEEAEKKRKAGLRLRLEIREAQLLVAEALAAAKSRAAKDASALRALAHALERSGLPEAEALDLLLSDATRTLLARTLPRHDETRLDREIPVWVDRPRAAFSAWYEMMPRSQAGAPGRHGTFDDVIARLPYVRDLGFDVLYFTPIHPIGKVNRKGRNNSLTSQEGEPGSPYAIGSSEGGHEAIHPELGTFEDFQRLQQAAHEHGLEIALDFAIQCAPDHPWIEQHPEWFDWRPDGTIKFAENPPKKYEDIVPVHFYRDAMPSIWLAMRDLLLLWAGRGVRIFRVDNPHTKPFPFWEWVIEEVHAVHPDVLFLSEAFTRPKPMKRLAKIGFTQSYSYFTWRTGKQEFIDYLTELTRSECRDYMRPNFFTNTPDINPFHLQTGGRPAFRTRLVLAATLAGNYGIYNGFELCEAAAVPGKEEYLNSEKYEIRVWDWEREGHIRDDIRLVNRVRRENEAMRDFRNVEFYNAWNDDILYYGRRTPDRSSFLLFAVNLDPHNAQGCHFEVPLWEFGLPDDASIAAEDLVTGRPFTWQGKIQHMWLDPAERPYCIWRLLAPETVS